MEAEFKALGYRIVTLSDLTMTPTLEQQLYELDREVYSDTSTVDPATFPPLEQWREDRLQDEDLLPDAFFIAALENQFIGYGNLWRGEREGELETGTFGTARAFRHHHHEIMLPIKAREIAYAKAQGYKTIRAEIDAENPWTLYICAELPFVQGKDYVSMVRVMNWTVR